MTQTDHIGIQSSLGEFSALLEWGLVAAIIVCFTVAVWTVYKHSGRAASVGERRRMDE